MDIIESMNMMRRLESLPEIYDAEDQSIIRTLHSYFSEMYEIELRDKSAIESGEKSSDYLSKSISEKTVIHKKYWSNPALYYVPCSICGEPKHVWSLLTNIEIFRNGDDENHLFIFSAKHPNSWGGVNNLVYLLKVVDGAIKIEHEFM
ncbi:hypothetical protein [Laribacter hongkongensis]|uniref:hypothetical protein n=1 Tax=Laribacter hongkongensis TaxID=168471 RepID=UPI0005A057C1|nr:hypothetical protein [Laribacter hongkongensis]